MKHLIIITTCERSSILLENLRLFPKQANIEFAIFQDGEHDYSQCLAYLKTIKAKFTWLKWAEKHGKEKFWQVHNEIYKFTKQKKFDLCHHIQDDCFISDNYFHFAEKVFTEFPRMTVLNTLAVKCHERRFTHSEKLYEFMGYNIYNLGKIDCNYIARRDYFAKLKWKVPEVGPDFDFRNGSGVGSHNTARLIEAGVKIYNISEFTQSSSERNRKWTHERTNNINNLNYGR